ncbi:hypothetical protein DQG23_15735 [Paenibacillus contaminans]|uniref:DUF3221 domain-containing protein n=2 Tax=Paenibacillus contaminans TaxID=450362 RepID=A0A329MKT4_9BACL|nr:hypothetical protein DQG23_15735 [Paenibacillus contaminans]
MQQLIDPIVRQRRKTLQLSKEEKMMKRLLGSKHIVIAVLTVLVVAGCGQSEPSTEMTGYVINRNASSILVVGDAGNKMQNSQTPEAMSLRIDGSTKWQGIASDKLKPGHKVKATIKGPIAESYPSQASANRIELLSPAQQEPGLLTEQEAIEKALALHSTAGSVYVYRTELIVNEKNWRIQLDDYLRPGNPVEVRIDAKPDSAK